MRYLEDYYNRYNEEERLLSRHGQVEYLTTMKYIRECLAQLSDPTILEVGAGTGRYSVTLSKQGYRVTAVELISRNLELLKSKLDGSEPITAMQGNALDLSGLQDASFSLTMLLGPMYHLYTQEDKLKALSEAVRVTKPGGFILVAYCMNDYAIVKHGFMEGTIKEAFTDNKVDINYNVMSTDDDLYDYVSIDEIDALARESGLIRKKIVTPDGPANYIRHILRDMDEESFELFVRYVETIAERKDMIGAAAHTVDILQKPID